VPAAREIGLGELTQQKALLDEVFARVPEAIVLLDRNDRVLQVNPEFTRIFGYSQQEVCGRLVSELIVPKELMVEAEEYSRRRLRGESLNVETVRTRKDGTRVHVSIVSAHVSIVGSQISEYVIYRDITERKRAEEALRQSEQDLRTITDTIRQPIIVLAPDGKTRYVNQVALDLTGFTRDALDERGFWARVVHPDDLIRLHAERRERLLSGDPFELEFRALFKNGQYRWQLMQYNPLKDESGQIIRWYSTATDIDDRKRAEEALQKSQFYLSEGQRLAHMGSWAFNATGFTYWSPELFQIHGLDPRGQPPTLEEYFALVHPEDRALMKQGITQMLVDHRAFDFTKRIVWPAGEIRSVRSVGVPVTQRGIFEGFLGTGIDVTEQELLTQQSERREAYLAEAQRLSQTGSWAWSPVTGDITYWSEMCYCVLGFDPAGPLPRFEEFLHRIHPDDQAPTSERFEKAIRDKADFEFEYRIVHPDKRIRDIHVVGHAVLDRSGSLTEFVGTVIDITERKRAEHELQQIVDLVPQFIVVLGPEGQCTYANRVAQEYTGLSLEVFRAPKVIGRIVHPDDLKKVLPERQRGLAGIEPFELDGRMLGKDGVYRWFLARYNPLIEGGRAIRWYMSATEIESRKREEERIRQENVRLEERSRIARELHDTLLQTVQGASLLLGAALDEESQDSSLKPRLQRILQLVGQAVEEGRSAIDGLRSSDSHTSDLVLALSRVQQELKLPSDIEFQVMVTGIQRRWPPRIQNEIYRIGREALVNAVCHSEAKRIDLELQYSDRELCMRIRDNGCGIDLRVLEKGRDRHWGLASMRERATRIGGLLNILTSPTAGTEVQLFVPNSTALDVSIPLDRSA
jgi:PAS domain S-box-containing protein